MKIVERLWIGGVDGQQHEEQFLSVMAASPPSRYFDDVPVRLAAVDVFGRSALVRAGRTGRGGSLSEEALPDRRITAEVRAHLSSRRHAATAWRQMLPLSEMKDR